MVNVSCSWVVGCGETVVSPDALRGGTIVEERTYMILRWAEPQRARRSQGIEQITNEKQQEGDICM